MKIVTLPFNESQREGLIANQERIERRKATLIKRKHLHWRLRKNAPALAEVLISQYQRQYARLAKQYMETA